MVTHLLPVALGGSLGAVFRYLLAGWVNQWNEGASFPWGTLTVNVLGSFSLGLLMALASDGTRGFEVPPFWFVLLGVGFLGAFTTFSTFSFETIQALRDGSPSIAFGNIVANVLLTLVACWVGLRLGEVFG